jgi:putative ATP-binding cassette transporter
MKLLELLRRETTTSLVFLLFIAGIAGLSNALVLAIINIAAENASQETQGLRYVLMFFIVILIYVIAQRYIMTTATSQVEFIIDKIRIRLADKVRKTELQPLDHIGRSVIYASLAKETITISQAAPVLVIAGQSGILIAFTVLYIAWLSIVAFFLAFAFTGIALSIHFKRVEKLYHDLHEAMARENKLFDAVTDMLDGFKETRMNSARSDDLYKHVCAISASTADLKARTQKDLVTHFIFSQVTFYFLLATMVFLVPSLSHTYSDVVVKTTTAILFLIGPISSLVSAVPLFATANVAAENIDTLDKNLSASVPEMPENGIKIHDFRTLILKDVRFHYEGPAKEPAFSVGPIDLDINAGEILFVTGGNGCGKSTFLKLLTALYPPSSGSIHIDDVRIDQESVQSYRNLFSVVFSDYHLFKRLYGLSGVTPQQFEALMSLMELEGKTDLRDGEFVTLDLSSGQRKRLALLVSLLEDKPIYVFDEWAADQDPIFRRKFYKELLLGLKQAGKTVIAVTHDDRYFDYADRRLWMENGRIVSISSQHHSND